MTDELELLSRPWPLTSACKSCGAKIRWAVAAATKANLPLDWTPVDDGNVLVVIEHGRIWADVLAGDELAQARQRGASLFKAHFATCPDAKAWRRARR